MGFALCDRSTGKVLGWARYDRFPVSAGQVEVEIDVPSRPLDELRWDGDKGLRVATSQEMKTPLENVLDDLGGRVLAAMVLTHPSNMAAFNSLPLDTRNRVREILTNAAAMLVAAIQENSL